MALATLIDLRALLNVAVVSVLAAVATVLAFGTAVLAADRLSAARSSGAEPPPAWLAALVLAATACAAIVAVGLHTLTQK
jgi:hypothetical protein